MFLYGFCLWFHQSEFSPLKYIIHLYILLCLFQILLPFFLYMHISISFGNYFGISDKLGIQHYYFLIVPMPFANTFDVCFYHILNIICWDRLLDIMLYHSSFSDIPLPVLYHIIIAIIIIVVMIVILCYNIWLGNFSTIRPFKIFFPIFLYLEFR